MTIGILVEYVTRGSVEASSTLTNLIKVLGPRTVQEKRKKKYKQIISQKEGISRDLQKALQIAIFSRSPIRGTTMRPDPRSEHMSKKPKVELSLV